MNGVSPNQISRPLSVGIPLAIALAASVVVVSGVTLIYPVLPIISNSFGIAESRIGLVIAAFTLPAVILAPLFGLLADLYGRRWLLIIGLVIFAGAGTAAAAAPSFEALILWRTIQGVGMSALSPLTIVLISDLCPQREQELQAQGWKVAIDRVAMIVLPLIGGVLATYSWGSAFLPFALVFPVAIAAFIWMPETRTHGAVDLRGYFRDIFLAVTEGKVSLAFAVGFFRFFLDYGFFVYLPLFLSLRYHASAITIGLIIAVSAAGAIVTATNVRILLKSTTIKRLLAFAFLITAIGLAVILTHPPLWMIGAGSFAIGLGNGLISPLQKSMITGNAPRDLRGGIISCDRVVQQIAKSLAPSLLGLLLLITPVEGVFLTLTGVGLVGTAMMLLTERRADEAT